MGTQPLQSGRERNQKAADQKISATRAFKPGGHAFAFALTWKRAA